MRVSGPDAASCRNSALRRMGQAASLKRKTDSNYERKRKACEALESYAKQFTATQNKEKMRVIKEQKAAEAAAVAEGRPPPRQSPRRGSKRKKSSTEASQEEEPVVGRPLSPGSTRGREPLELPMDTEERAGVSKKRRAGSGGKKGGKKGSGRLMVQVDDDSLQRSPRRPGSGRSHAADPDYSLEQLASASSAGLSSVDEPIDPNVSSFWEGPTGELGESMESGSGGGGAMPVGSHFSPITPFPEFGNSGKKSESKTGNSAAASADDDEPLLARTNVEPASSIGADGALMSAPSGAFSLGLPTPASVKAAFSATFGYGSTPRIAPTPSRLFHNVGTTSSGGSGSSMLSSLAWPITKAVEFVSPRFWGATPRGIDAASVPPLDDNALLS
eukprot:SAG11_NODE_1189_length_5576_cov_3.002739_4_plen_388_part_00